MNYGRLERYLCRELKKLGITNIELMPAIRHAILLAEDEDSVIQDLIETLQTRIVHFQFRKTDGSLREAWGTLKSKLIDAPELCLNNRSYNKTCVCYFDLEKNDWRTFKTKNFIDIID